VQTYIKCASCGTRIRADRQNCLRCGEPLKAAPRNQIAAPVSRPTLLVVFLGALALVVSGFFLLRGSRGSLTAAPGTAASSDPAADARAAFARGDFKTAKSLYDLIVSRKPNDPDALDKLGQTLMKLGDAQGAFQRFSLAVKFTPDSWAYHTDLARAAVQLSRWDSAITEYRAAATLAPTDFVTRYDLANALHKSGDEQAAIEEFQKAIDLQPNEPGAHLSLGVSFEAAGRPADAVREYTRYLDLSPSAPGADTLRAHVRSLSR